MMCGVGRGDIKERYKYLKTELMISSLPIISDSDYGYSLVDTKIINLIRFVC